MFRMRWAALARDRLVLYQRTVKRVVLMPETRKALARMPRPVADRILAKVMQASRALS